MESSSVAITDFDMIGEMPAPISHMYYRPEPSLALVEKVAALGLLADVGEMEENWDGFGALPVSKATLSNSQSILMLLMSATSAPEIDANPNGTVSFDWRSERGAAHIEIGETRFSSFIRPTSESAVLFEGNIDEVRVELGELINAVLFPAAESSTATTHFTFVADHER